MGRKSNRGRPCLPLAAQIAGFSPLERAARRIRGILPRLGKKRVNDDLQGGPGMVLYILLIGRGVRDPGGWGLRWRLPDFVNSGA